MIIRRRITSNFTIIPNEAILDVRLSIASRWLLAYLLSRPNDWQVQVGDIQKKGGIGREKAYRLIKELISVGWVRKDFSRGEGGQWGGVDYVVMDQLEVEEVSVSPCAEKPYTVKPHTVNHHLTKDLKKPRTEKVANTEEYISSNSDFDAEFEEFWAAYPPKPANPRKKAKDKYIAIRKQKVSHETIVNAAKKYAAMRAGEDPKFTAQAVTWLNQWRFEDDYEVDGGTPSTESAASDEDLNKLAAVYPGHIGDRERAKKLLTSEMAKGVSLVEFCALADKYSLFCKGNPYENRRITPAMLETWLQFKWREMDAYEVCRVGADRIRTVRPIKVGK